MIRKKGECVKCYRTTFNSKSGLCRQCWEDKAWGKDRENIRIYSNGEIDGEFILKAIPTQSKGD